jgi:hypothetical protein
MTVNPNPVQWNQNLSPFIPKLYTAAITVKALLSFRWKNTITNGVMLEVPLMIKQELDAIINAYDAINKMG